MFNRPVVFLSALVVFFWYASFPRSPCECTLDAPHPLIQGHDKKDYYNGHGTSVGDSMTLLGCPRCNRDTMKYAEDRKPAR